MYTFQTFKNHRFQIIIFVLLPYLSTAQLNKQWEVNLPQNDFTYIKGDKLQFDGTGKLYTFTRYISEFQQYQTTKIDDNGNILWANNETSGMEHYFPSQMIVSGTAYVLGYSNSSYHYLINYKAAGGLKADDYQENLTIPRMAKDPSGNILVTGLIDLAGTVPIRLTKYSAAGDVLWQNDYYPGNELTSYSSYLNVTADAEGNFYIATSHMDGNPFPDPSVSSIRILKVDADGNEIWEQTVESSEEGQYIPTDIQYNSIDNRVYVVYEFNSLTVACLDKVSGVGADGTIVWTKSLAGNQGGGDNRVRIGQDGSIYWWQSGGSLGSFYGYAYSGGYSYKGTILKYNSEGMEQWSCSGSAFTVDAAGYVYTIYAGYDFGPVVRIQKYSPAGALLWDVPDYAPYSYDFLDVYCDNGDNLYAMAGLNGTTTSIIKYDVSCSFNKAPAKPSSLDGPVTNVCDGISYDYSCPIVNKATHYYWSVPDGAYLNGQGTNNVTISFPSGFTNGKISVYASNCLDASKSVSLNVYGIPGKPGTITGASSVCANQNNVSYSINPVQGAVSYNWKVPDGAIITSGQGSTAITVNYGSAGGKVKVKSKSDCGNSAYKNLEVSMVCRESNAFSSNTFIYPNPSVSDFSIRTEYEFDELRIKDLLGRAISLYPFKNGMTFGSELPQGVYFAELISGDNVNWSGKIIKIE